MNSDGKRKFPLFRRTKDSNSKSLWKPKVTQFIRGNLLVIATFVSVLLGIGVGCILRATKDKWTEREIMYVNFVGDLFLRMLKCLVLPLIMTSLITGISSLDISLSRKIGGRAVVFYLTTTFLAVILGLALVCLIKPGEGGKGGATKDIKKNVSTVDTLLDLLRNLLPPNIIQACLQQTSTQLTPKENADNSTGTSIDDYKIDINFIPGTNIIGIVAVSTVIGIAMSILQAELAYFIAITQELFVLSMKLTVWATSLSPIGIFFLVASEILKMENLKELGASLGLYFVTVVLGCFIQGFIFLPLMYFFLTRKNPFRFIQGLSQALVTAFGTSSSSATMPVTLKCVIENNKVDENVAKFMLPIGSAINMDGTALYEAVAAVFIAQLRQVELTFVKLIAISITATAASIGAAGIPSAGLVTMIMVLDTVGLPAQDVSLILSVDWLLDRIRTVINVMGDSFGAGIINHLSRDAILEMNQRHSISTAPTSTHSMKHSSQSLQRIGPSTISIGRNETENK